jgi:galactofuranose transport system substrate-binding protein
LTAFMKGEAKIIQLEGSTGSSPANDRASGFADYIKDKPGMQIIASQSGDFARDKGRQVFETLYQAHPDATALYSHNDEMTMGAIAAMEAAGKVPGKDLIIATIDGTKDATQAILDGKVLVCIECNPKFGPAAFDAIVRLGNGETLEPKLVNTDRVFTADNAAAYMPEAY